MRILAQTFDTEVRESLAARAAETLRPRSTTNANGDDTGADMSGLIRRNRLISTADTAMSRELRFNSNAVGLVGGR